MVDSSLMKALLTQIASLLAFNLFLVALTTSGIGFTLGVATSCFSLLNGISSDDMDDTLLLLLSSICVADWPFLAAFLFSRLAFCFRAFALSLASSVTVSSITVSTCGLSVATVRWSSALCLVVCCFCLFAFLSFFCFFSLLASVFVALSDACEWSVVSDGETSVAAFLPFFDFFEFVLAVEGVGCATASVFTDDSESFCCLH